MARGEPQSRKEEDEKLGTNNVVGESKISRQDRQIHGKVGGRTDVYCIYFSNARDLTGKEDELRA